MRHYLCLKRKGRGRETNQLTLCLSYKTILLLLLAIYLDNFCNPQPDTDRPHKKLKLKLTTSELHIK